MDQPFVLYSLIFASSIYGLLLFMYGWFRYKTRSAMYVYVTLLFFAFAVMEAFNLYARSLRFKNMEVYTDFMATPIWSFRLYIILFVITAIPVHMTLRMLRGKEKSGEHETEAKQTGRG